MDKLITEFLDSLIHGPCAGVPFHTYEKWVRTEAQRLRRTVYMLTDGQDILKVKAMTRADYADATQAAQDATDGNLRWEPANGKAIVKTLSDRQRGIALAAIIDGTPVAEAIDDADSF